MVARAALSPCPYNESVKMKTYHHHQEHQRPRQQQLYDPLAERPSWLRVISGNKAKMAAAKMAVKTAPESIFMDQASDLGWSGFINQKCT